jgi:hypothetical protein
VKGDVPEGLKQHIGTPVRFTHDSDLQHFVPEQQLQLEREQFEKLADPYAGAEAHIKDELAARDAEYIRDNMARNVTLGEIERREDQARKRLKLEHEEEGRRLLKGDLR